MPYDEQKQQQQPLIILDCWHLGQQEAFLAQCLTTCLRCRLCLCAPFSVSLLSAPPPLRPELPPSAGICVVVDAGHPFPSPPPSPRTRAQTQEAELSWSKLEACLTGAFIPNLLTTLKRALKTQGQVKAGASAITSMAVSGRGEDGGAGGGAQGAGGQGGFGWMYWGHCWGFG